MRALLLAAAATMGCHHESEENLGLSAKRRDLDVDVRALTRPGELEKALALPSEELAKRLGPHRVNAVTKLSMTSGTSGESVDSLDETFHLDVDGKGAMHLTRENSHDDGMESIATGGAYFVRPRYGRFVTHAPEGDEVAHACDEVTGLAGGYFAVLGRFAARADGGSGEYQKRKIIKLKISLAPSPGPFTDPDPSHAWRGTVEVSALDGEVWVDETTGAPVHALLDAKYRSHRDAREVAVAMHYQSDVEEMGAIPPITAPADAVAAISRVRPLVDRQALLDGLAPSRGGKRLGDDTVPRLDGAGRKRPTVESKEAP